MACSEQYSRLYADPAFVWFHSFISIFKISLSWIFEGIKTCWHMY
jgi:hypothetical protein